MNIELHIERLVLHGIAPGERYRVGAAVERELARLIEERGVPDQLTRGGDVARLDGGSFAIEPGMAADALGAAIARAVYGGMSR
jgi:hypothetical protein